MKIMMIMIMMMMIVMIICKINVVLVNSSSQVEYVKALDIWTVMSLVFIIVAMLETVLVTWMYQKADQNEEAVSHLHVDEDK